ncbi:Nup93/Nic96-domain-containing protein [Blakeslea trispora]|nr:Nup93/Nic96-domain-containing protein [Blakeslea trispora]
MFKNILRQLQEQSDLLIPSAERDAVPLIHRSLEQTEKESSTMAGRIRHDPELDARADGVDLEHVVSPIDTSRAFEVVEEEDHTDVKKYLEEEHERVLITVIEEQRRLNEEEFDAYFEAQHQTHMMALLKERQEEADNRNDFIQFQQHNNGSGISRILEFANAVRQLNENRSLDMDFDVIQAFASIQNMSELQKAQASAYEAWNILSHLVKNTCVDSRSEGQFTRQIATEPYESALYINTRQQLMNASRSWLEKQMHRMVNETLNKHATQIQIGGNPSVIHRLRAFILYTFKTSTGWTDDRLEIVEELPIWAFVYFLIRTGHLQIAAQFVEEQQALFFNERRFVTYFLEYANHQNVSKSMREAIRTDFIRFSYGEDVVDPYKIILYKILGRCELHNKTVPDVIRNVEDFIWLQLVLIRNPTLEQQTEQDYTLLHAQMHIESLGEQYFDQEEFDPWNYFKILLYTLQFEKAINYLCRYKHLRLETVHFAIALAYHGLLRIPEPSKTTNNTLLIKADEQHYQLNLVRLIHLHIQAWIPADQPQYAVQYFYLLTLYSTKQGYKNNDMVPLVISHLIRYTVEAKQFEALIGTLEAGYHSGLLYKQKELLHMFSDRDYTRSILVPMAEKYAAIGRPTDAVYIYGLSGEYNAMIDVLAKKLSHSLQTRPDPIYQNNDNEATIQFAMETMSHYEKREQFSIAVDSHRRLTIRTLVDLLIFRRSYQHDTAEHALQKLIQLNIIPLTLDYDGIQQAVAQFNTGLDQTIKDNIPELLMNAMDVVYRTWVDRIQITSPTTSQVNEIQQLKQMARGILTFTGLLQMFIPNDTLIRLTKTELMMQQKRRL